jgi:hypothetical protein
MVFPRHSAYGFLVAGIFGIRAGLCGISGIQLEFNSSPLRTRPLYAPIPATIKASLSHIYGIRRGIDTKATAANAFIESFNGRQHDELLNERSSLRSSMSANFW